MQQTDRCFTTTTCFARFTALHRDCYDLAVNTVFVSVDKNAMKFTNSITNIALRALHENFVLYMRYARQVYEDEVLNKFVVITKFQAHSAGRRNGIRNTCKEID